MNKIRSIFKCHGGKSLIKNWIISNFPTNYQKFYYAEIYGGAANILLNKQKSNLEIYNDIDKCVFNVLNCLKTKSNEVINSLNEIEYNLDTFELAKNNQLKHHNTAIKEAVNEIIIRRMSRGGLKKTFSWSSRKRGGQPGDVNAWENFKKNINEICYRLQNVILFNEDAVEVIKKYDSKDIFFYADPPYLKSTRTSKNIYDFEMTEEDHIKLAECLNGIQGKAMISGYESELYKKLYKGWKKYYKDMPNHSSQQKEKQRRTEIIWCNY